MTTRREFIEGSLVASFVGTIAATPATGFAAGTSTGRPSRLPFFATVFDRRFRDGLRFSAAMQRLGIRGRAIAGDVTDVWYSELHPRWKEGAVPIAGLTTYAPLFCLERLAWDHNMRVLYRASHRRGPDGTMEHRLESSPQQSAVTLASLSGRGTWSTEIATLIADMPPHTQPVPLNPNAVSTTTRIGRGAAPAHEPGELLYSWVIAPRARA
jgi:hypothetical protein